MAVDCQPADIQRKDFMKYLAVGTRLLIVLFLFSTGMAVAVWVKGGNLPDPLCGGSPPASTPIYIYISRSSEELNAALAALDGVKHEYEGAARDGMSCGCWLIARPDERRRWGSATTGHGQRQLHVAALQALAHRTGKGRPLHEWGLCWLNSFTWLCRSWFEQHS